MIKYFFTNNNDFGSVFHGHSWAMKFLLKTAKRIKIGSLTINLPDGESHTYLGTIDGPYGEITIRDPIVAKRLITGGMLGFCEAYDEGLVDSPDLDTFYTVILANEKAIEDPLAGKWWYRLSSWMTHKMRRNSKKGSDKNIAAHYDLGNEFYESWLDRSMTYSSALYKNETDGLEQAQFNKYQNLVELLEIKPEHHILEIGCGWGGFAEHVAKHVGARTTAITISKEQFNYAENRLNNLSQTNLKLIDYRDIDGMYDRIVSIEMFEAVGEEYWPIYFKTLYDRLKPGGKAGLQIITIDESRFENYRTTPDYIQKYIFPGGMLPSITALQQQAKHIGLEWDTMQRFGKDYARTLRDWNDRFQKAWPKITQLKTNRKYDERFKRMWEQYMAYCAAGFTCETIDVIQCTLSKPN
jgi:cyclopropane-fatty-acyl-phospholipid synthase